MASGWAFRPITPAASALARTRFSNPYRGLAVLRIFPARHAILPPPPRLFPAPLTGIMLSRWRRRSCSSGSLAVPVLPAIHESYRRLAPTRRNAGVVLFFFDADVL